MTTARKDRYDVVHFGGPNDGAIQRWQILPDFGEYYRVYACPGAGAEPQGRYVIDGDADFRFFRWEGA